MERLNSEGLPRWKLVWALGQPRLVAKARAMNRCLLCRKSQVNEAALCDSCTAVLDDEELRLVERWMGGVGP